MMKYWFKIAFIVLCWLGLALVLSACGVTSPTPSPVLVGAATPLPVGTEGLVVEPTITAPPSPIPPNTPIPTTAAPTNTIQASTNTPRPTSTATRRPATAVPRAPTPAPTLAPTPVPGPAGTCAALQAKGLRDIFVLYINAVPELVWDNNPHYLKVGVCNTLPPPSTPQGKYRLVMSFPDGGRGLMTTPIVSASLNAGMNEVSVGPWVPGLENHIASCNMRAVAQTQVMYNDVPDLIFHALKWPDGTDTASLPIKCGGNFS